MTLGETKPEVSPSVEGLRAFDDQIKCSDICQLIRAYRCTDSEHLYGFRVSMPRYSLSSSMASESCEGR